MNINIFFIVSSHIVRYKVTTKIQSLNYIKSSILFYLRQKQASIGLN